MEREPSAGLYSRLYDRLIADLRREGRSSVEAARLAVGGDYDVFGCIERDALLSVGMGPDSFVVDLGCGAGRLARKLVAPSVRPGRYFGLDVHAGLLEEARTQTKSLTGESEVGFEFAQVTLPRIPCGEESVDFLTAFSVATHIEPEETFSYMKETARILKRRGLGLISYLSAEIQSHWEIFLDECAIPVEERRNRVPNKVHPPGALGYLAERAGLEVLSDHPADLPWIPLTESMTFEGESRKVGDRVHLGQSCLIVRPKRTESPPSQVS